MVPVTNEAAETEPVAERLLAKMAPAQQKEARLGYGAVAEAN